MSIGLALLAVSVRPREHRDRVPTALEDAWALLDAATPPGWWVGQPSLHDERHQWEQYAFDPSEKPEAGARSREWTAIAPQEVGPIGVVLEMARRLRAIRAGRVPKGVDWGTSRCGDSVTNTTPRRVRLVSSPRPELKEARAEAAQRLVGRLNRALNDGQATMPEFAA